VHPNARWRFATEAWRLAPIDALAQQSFTMNVTSPFAAIPPWLILAILIPLAAYFLQVAANFCGVDLPSFKRSALIAVGVGAVAFFTFDGLGYGLAIGMRDVTHLTFPPGYGYSNWLQEPMYLKWQVLGVVPVLRYLPIVFAICLAATLYVFLLKENFRVVLVVFFMQWVLTIVAMSLVAFALSNFLGVFRPQGQQQPAVAHTPQGPDPRAVTRPRPIRRGTPQPAPAPQPPAAAPGTQEGVSLRDTLAHYQAELSPFLAKAREALDAFYERINPYLEPVKEAAAPYTRYLPDVVQEFLDDGGWFWVLLGLTVIGLLGLRSIYVRFKRSFRRRKKQRARVQKHIEIDLEEVSGAFTEPGANQITVREFPGRVRLVVMAPASSYVGELLPEMAESLLDWIKPGLGEVYETDSPRSLVWPRMSSENRFLELFSRAVRIPEPPGRRTPWVVLAGTTQLGRQRIYLGVGVHLDKAGYLREIRVEKGKWSEVLGIQPTPED
jgi:hypothetical protein